MDTHPAGAAPDAPAAWDWRRITAQRFDGLPGRSDIPAAQHHRMAMHLAWPAVVEDLNSRRKRGWPEKGQVAFTPAGISKAHRITGRPDVLLIHIAPALVDEVLMDAHDVDPASVSFIDRLAVPDPTSNRLSQMLVAEAKANAPAGHLFADIVAQVLAVQMLRNFSTLARRGPAAPRAMPDSRVRRAIEHMKGYLTNPLPLDQLAALAETSPSQFARAFREATGKPPHRYLIGLRIAEAQACLGKRRFRSPRSACAAGSTYPATSRPYSAGWWASARASTARRAAPSGCRWPRLLPGGGACRGIAEVGAGDWRSSWKARAIPGPAGDMRPGPGIRFQRGAASMKLPSKSMRAVIVDRAAPGGLRIANVAHPIPVVSEALVRVAATSLDSGEVELALAGGMTGTRPGWDLAGTIEASAADGTGPPAGTRVVGLVCAGAWAELVAVPIGSLAVLPPAVPFAQAAALPVAGLTALHALSLGGLLAGKRVLIIGATGSAGLFAVQLAYASGACITAVIRHPEHEALVEEFGAQHVVVGDVSGAASFGQYHLSLDTVGGLRAEAVLGLLRPRGTSVLICGAGAPDAPSAGRPSSEEGAGLHRFSLRDALRHEPASEGLERLVILAKTHKVYPHVEVEGALTDVVALAQALLDPLSVGKTVLLA